MKNGHGENNILLMTSPAPNKSGFYLGEKRPPLGVGYLIAILKQNGYNVFFQDHYLKRQEINLKNVDIIGIYSNTVCFQQTLELLKEIKQKDWKGKIIIGGPHTSIGADMIPDYVDHIVIGEGEQTILDILSGKETKRIIQGKKIQELDNLPILPMEYFNDLPYDTTNQWLKQKKNIFTLNTSRGCPFNCSFCSVKSVWGREYRYMSAERVIEDVKILVNKYQADGIYFREDHFIFNKQRTIDFCESLLKQNIVIDWICETRVELLDDLEFQKLLYKAGCRLFYIGVESGSPRMLKLYKKGETVEQFIKAFNITKKSKIKTYASMLTGLPMETKEDKKMSKELIKEIKPDFINYNYYVGIPGSEIYDYLYKNNLYEYIDKNKILYPIGFLDNNIKHKNKHVYQKKDRINHV